jgi:hypothetical protein
MRWEMEVRGSQSEVSLEKVSVRLYLKNKLKEKGLGGKGFKWQSTFLISRRP